MCNEGLIFILRGRDGKMYTTTQTFMNIRKQEVIEADSPKKSNSITDSKSISKLWKSQNYGFWVRKRPPVCGFRVRKRPPVCRLLGFEYSSRFQRLRHVVI